MVLTPDATAGTSYTISYSGTAIEDAAGNNLAAIVNYPVTNITPNTDPTSPFSSAGKRKMLRF